MPLHIVDKVVRDVLVLDMRGRITLGPETQSLRQKVKAALDAGYLRIVLDLGQVDYIDSSGLATLISASSSARSVGGELKLLHLTQQVNSLLQITRLSTVFEVFDSFEQACGSFARPPD
jgi:anti-sigma B factor antagonist